MGSALAHFLLAATLPAILCGCGLQELRTMHAATECLASERCESAGDLLEAFTAQADHLFASLRPQTTTLFEELRALNDSTAATPAFFTRGCTWYLERVTGEGYPSLFRRCGESRTLILSPDAVMPGERGAIGLLRLSPDTRKLLFRYESEVRHDGSQLRVMDIAQGRSVIAFQGEEIHGTEWLPQSDAFMFTTENERRRPWRLYRHAGSPALLLEENDESVELHLREASGQILVDHVAAGAAPVMPARGAFRPAVQRSFDGLPQILVHTSLREPEALYFADNLSTPIWTEPVPGYDPAAFRMQTIEVPARDGETIPIDLLFAAATPPSPSSPLLLHSYGAYGTIPEDAFDATLVPLLRRGVVYAVAHIRGGGEKGEAWHLQGIADGREKSITDLLDAAHGLVSAGVANPAAIVSLTRSAGAIAALNAAFREPALFRALLLEQPFVDPLAAMRDAARPGTLRERAEWGTPEEQDAITAMEHYSPLVQIPRNIALPPMLIFGGLDDPVTPPLDVIRWAAMMRVRNRTQVYLSLSPSAGHEGEQNSWDALIRRARMWSFLLISRETMPRAWWRACRGVRGNRIGYAGLALAHAAHGITSNAPMTIHDGTDTHVLHRAKSVLFANIKSIMGIAQSNPHSSIFDQRIECVIVENMLNYAAMLSRFHLPLLHPRLIGSASTWELTGLPPEVPIQIDGEPRPEIKASHFRISCEGTLPMLTFNKAS